jgi:hypothetical protein
MAKSIDLSKYGTPKELFDTKPGNPLEQYIFNWFEDVTKKMQDELKDDSASGSLSQSIETQAKGTGEGIQVSLIMNDYWKFQNKGVSGVINKFNSPYSFKTIKPSKGMVDSMMQTKWAGFRGLRPQNGDLKGMLYAISVNVKKKGIEPTYFYDKVINDKSLEELEQKILNDFGIQLELKVIEYASNNN